MTKTDPKTKRRLAQSLESFASGKKGVTRAIQEAKHRKQHRVKNKAILLRKYNKVKKQQGYAQEKSNEQSHDDDDDKKQARRHKKPDPLQKSRKRAQEYKRQQEEQRQQALLQQEENEKKLKKRRQRSKQLSKRTKKGQPIMKHQIHCILEKLQKDA